MAKARWTVTLPGAWLSVFLRHLAAAGAEVRDRQELASGAATLVVEGDRTALGDAIIETYSEVRGSPGYWRRPAVPTLH